VVDVTPAVVEVVEPSQQPDAHASSPTEAEGADEGNVPRAELELVNAKKPQENPIGRLH
jgi:hypothetical protein